MTTLDLPPPPKQEQVLAPNQIQDIFNKHLQNKTEFTMPCEVTMKELEKLNQSLIPFDMIVCKIIDWEF